MRREDEEGSGWFLYGRDGRVFYASNFHGEGGGRKGYLWMAIGEGERGTGRKGERERETGKRDGISDRRVFFLLRWKMWESRKIRPNRK